MGIIWLINLPSSNGKNKTQSDAMIGKRAWIDQIESADFKNVNVITE
jgi:hypothetical protein